MDLNHYDFMLGVYVILLISLLLYAGIVEPPLFPNYKYDIIDIGQLSFYHGVVDAYSNFITHKFVCRSTNIYRTLKVLLSNSTNATFYIILDKYHVRTYLPNGTFMDVTAPSYKFSPLSTRIIKCIVVDKGVAYSPKCTYIYYDGKVLSEEAEPILKRLFNETRS